MKRTIFSRFLIAALFGLCLITPQASKANIYDEAQLAMDLYINDLSVGQVFIEHENLRIFLLGKPVYKHTKENYFTLDETTDKKLLKIKEVNQYGTVNTVKMKNHSKIPVFIMKGEIITGAKQDRMASRDIIIPANKKWVEVPVFCVEHGRWHHKSKEFSSGKLCVPNSVRKTATKTACQSDVWAEISSLQYECSVNSGTQTVVDNYENKNIKKQLETYTERLKNLPNLSGKTVGVVVTTGDRIICVDSFANHSLFTRLWPKLLKSYAMDAINNGSAPTVELEEVLELAQDIANQKPLANDCTKDKKSKLGEYFTCNCAAGTGSALIHFYPNFFAAAPEVIHCDFFPANSNNGAGRVAPPSQRRQRRGLGIHVPDNGKGLGVRILNNGRGLGVRTDQRPIWHARDDWDFGSVLE